MPAITSDGPDLPCRTAQVREGDPGKGATRRRTPTSSSSSSYTGEVGGRASRGPHIPCDVGPDVQLGGRTERAGPSHGESATLSSPTHLAARLSG